MQNRKVGAWLLLAGIVLAVIGGFLWSGENSRVKDHNEEAALSRGFSESLFGNSGGFPDIKPNHVPSDVLWVVGGSAGLFGMLLIAGAPNATKPPSEDGDS